MELRDGELLLRPPGPADIDAVVSACSDEAIVRFIPLIPVPYERSDAESWIDRCRQVWAANEACPFVIVEAATGALIGAIEVRPGDGSIGYWVAAAARGRGVATRALRLVCEWRTERPLWLMTHPENVASQRVAAKAGFRRVGMMEHLPAFRDGLAEAVRFELSVRS